MLNHHSEQDTNHRQAPQLGSPHRRPRTTPDLSVEAMPAVGEVVLCRFPLGENLANPGPKKRPGLVLAHRQRKSGERVMAIAYGTSQRTKVDELWRGEFAVYEAEHLKACGLHAPTKFALTRIAWIPWKQEFFSWSRQGRCVLGKVPIDLAATLDTAIGRRLLLRQQ